LNSLLYFITQQIPAEGHRIFQTSRAPYILKGFDTTEKQYKEAIARIKDYIRAGDTYQVNYTIRGRFSFEGDPALLYEALRMRQPVPYGGFVRACGMSVLSLSPELFFRIRDGFIESRPMKGTVKRGRWLEEDAAKARWLFEDEKNRAENVMIVDLIRNDLGRICEIGTVAVPKLFEIERYETLFQMTSLVRGRLKEGKWCAKDVFKALFPCGSVTGAPKIRTMEIIAELENSPRGIYCGAIGFMHRSQSVFNVAIRTVTLSGSKGEIGIGSGVTIDSIDEVEYGETTLKMDFLTKPLEDFTLIETMLVDENGTIPYLSLHMDRLKRSAQYFSFFMDEREVLDTIKRKIADSDYKRPFILRLSLKRGGEIEVSERAFSRIAEPVKVTLSNVRIDPDDKYLYHKTSKRGIFDRELKKARARGFFECILLNIKGEVTQGSFTNVFLERNGLLYTPPVEAGLLPGVLRSHLLSSGAAKEIPLGPKDFEEGNLYVGNSVRGLLRASIDLTSLKDRS